MIPRGPASPPAWMTLAHSGWSVDDARRPVLAFRGGAVRRLVPGSGEEVLLVRAGHPLEGRSAAGRDDLTGGAVARPTDAGPELAPVGDDPQQVPRRVDVVHRHREGNRAAHQVGDLAACDGCKL